MRHASGGCVLALLSFVWVGCGGSESALSRLPVAPSAPIAPSAPVTPVPPATSTFHVTGVVTEDDGTPLAGATVTIQPFVYSIPTSGIPSVSSTTDRSGAYRMEFEANRNWADRVGYVQAESAGHDTASYDILSGPLSQNASQNLHVYRIRRITAGESTVLTVAPGDAACGDSDQFVCRTVHIMAPANGTMTLEAVPTSPAVDAGLETVGRNSPYRCCEPTASIRVTAGAEIFANIGMSATSTASQSFVLRTSQVQP
jgi:hypothetical protein